MREKEEKAHSYDDLLYMPHPISHRHKKMPIADRAAQFAPFAALTGYEDAVKETARLTEDRVELDESRTSELDESLRQIQEHLKEEPEVSITFFCEDRMKSGGSYRTETGRVYKLDLFEKRIILRGDIRIPLADIVAIHCGPFLEESDEK